MISSSDAPSGHPVLVLGGRGFVGAHVTEALIASGRRPHLFGPPMEEDLLADLAGAFDETEGSIEDRDGLRRVLSATGATEVVSMAAYSSGRVGLMRSGEAGADRALAVNFEGFRTLCEAALEAGVNRLVWTSSTVVYGDPADYGDQPVTEADRLAPRTFYGFTKQLAEAAGGYYARRHDMQVTGLRLPLVLGPKLWYAGAASEILEAARAAASGRAHEVAFHDDPMDLMHVRDTARALVACLDHEGHLGEVYNINGFRTGMGEILAGLRQRCSGWEFDHHRTPPTQQFPAVNDARFRTDLGFTPDYDLEAVLDGLLQEETIT